MSARHKFDRLVLGQLLPNFCDHHGHDVAGFQAETLDRIREYDARWFLEALGSRVVAQEGAFFRSTLSGAKEQIFWHGKKAVSPRQLTLWVEPVITIGAAGRLHIEFGWPQELIGLQSKGNWAFDLVAYDRLDLPRVVCEVKKSRQEVDRLIQATMTYLSQPPLHEEPLRQGLRNAYKKVVALRQMSPDFLWVLGPDDYCKVFRVRPDPSAGRTRLEEVGVKSLTWPPIHS